MTEVAFHFDVLCPWAYQASTWIREVRLQRDITVTWWLFSLEEAKCAPAHKHPWELDWSWGWPPWRIAYLRRVDRDDAVDRFYAAAARCLHELGQAAHTRDGARSVPQRSGWDPSLLDAAAGDGTTNTDVLADHRRAAERGVYGVPTLVIDDTGILFGPVRAEAPEGPAAARLWDSLSAWSEFPDLYEVARPKRPADRAYIRSVFATYRRATAEPRRTTSGESQSR